MHRLAGSSASALIHMHMLDADHLRALGLMKCPCQRAEDCDGGERGGWRPVERAGRRCLTFMARSTVVKVAVWTPGRIRSVAAPITIGCVFRSGSYPLRP
jgi:hypothetical protein